MSNPIFNLLGGNQFGNMSGLIQQFQQFKQQFSGDPKAQVQQLLNSGKISQAQYDQAVQMANAMKQFLK